MILTELTNWNESRTAILDSSNECIYLYSNPHADNLEMKTMWIANTVSKETSENSIKNDMQNGLQPYIPVKFCSEKGIISDYTNKEDWRLQWGLDQNSIAVFFKEELIAVLPEWSGYNGFSGYSAGVTCETPMAWPLSSENQQIKRINEEAEFLNSWDDDSWPRIQEALLKTYDGFMSANNRYFSADGGKWPPLGLNYCSDDNLHFWSTVGMSILPMPCFGMNRDDTDRFRRIELAMLVKSEKETMSLGSYLSAQATYPWYFGTHFDHGHTIPCQQLADLGSKMNFMLIVEDAPQLPELLFPAEFNSRLLFMVPIHSSEQVFAEKNSSDDLLKIFEKNNIDLLNLERNPVV